MHSIKNSLDISQYLLLTMLSVSGILLFIDPQHYLLMLGFLSAIILNQYFLFVVVGEMTGIAKNTTHIPTWILAISKFIILIIGVLVAVHKLPNRVHIIVGIYIFQLIILALSTKRIVKKI